jgi:hypothetical protein
MKNLREAIEGCLSVEVEAASSGIKDRVIEIAI